MVVSGSPKRWQVAYNPPISSIYHLYTTYSPCLLPIWYRSHLLGEPASQPLISTYPTYYLPVCFCTPTLPLPTNLHNSIRKTLERLRLVVPGRGVEREWVAPLSRVITPGKPMYKAIYKGYNSIYDYLLSRPGP